MERAALGDRGGHHPHRAGHRLLRDERDVAKEYLTRILAITPADENERGLVEQARQQLEELESI